RACMGGAVVVRPHVRAGALSTVKQVGGGWGRLVEVRGGRFDSGQPPQTSTTLPNLPNLRRRKPPSYCVSKRRLYLCKNQPQGQHARTAGTLQRTRFTRSGRPRPSPHSIRRTTHRHSPPGTPVRGRNLARAGTVWRGGHRGGAFHRGDFLRHIGAGPVAGGARPAGSSPARSLPLAALDGRRAGPHQTAPTRPVEPPGRDPRRDPAAPAGRRQV